MASPSTTPTAGDSSFLNHPYITTITATFVNLQKQNFFSKQRLNLLKNHFLITIGFLVLLYCLIHIQILFFGLIKLIFRVVFRVISIIFWLPLKFTRLFIPKNIDYDILFPLVWLCSIVSFYLSKNYHEIIWQWFNQYLVPRYPIFRYDQNKREEIKRTVFVGTFVVVLLLQSVFILLPITLSIRHQHHQIDNQETSSSIPVVKKTTATTTSSARTAVKEAVETMGENLYHRFIDAFSDENETDGDPKRRSPLISDEQLEDTLKVVQQSIKKKIDKLKPTKDEQQEQEQEKQKSSRFQRWIMHYLTAPFQKWEKKNDQEMNLEKQSVRDHEEENRELHSSSDTDDDDDEEEQTSIPERIRQRLEKMKNLGEKLKNKISSSKDEESDDDDDDDEESSSKKLSSSNVDDDDDDEESDHDESDDEDDEEKETTFDQIKEKLAKPIGQAQTIAQTVAKQIRKKFSSSTDQEDDDENDRESGYESDEEEESLTLTEKVKQTFAQPIKKAKHVASDITKKITSPKDEDSDEESTTLTGEIKERLSKAKDLGEKTLSDVKSKFSSLVHTDEEESKIESDEEEDHQSMLDRLKENIFKPIETVATNIRDKLSSREDEDDDQSFIERTKETTKKLLKPLKKKISSTADELKHSAENLVNDVEEKASDFAERSSKFVREKTKRLKDSLPTTDQLKHQEENLVHDVEEKASDLLERSSKFLHDKTEQVKDSLPSTDQLKSKLKHQIVEPLEEKAAELKNTVVKKMKSLKTKKSKKTLTEKAKDKVRSISKSIREKLPDQQKKKKKSSLKKLQLPKRINGWFDDAWNIWHLTKTKLVHIFLPSTKHARLLPRYNTTSLYTAYTDVHCYDYTKKFNRYRLLKRKYTQFLDLYRHHSPFPVYLSVLKSNGPRCYRQYPDSSCGILSKSPQRSFKVQLYRFVRFWAIIGVLVILLAVIYQNFANRQQRNPSSSFHPSNDSDRSSSSLRKQQTTTTTPSNPTDSSKSRPNQQTTNNHSQPLDKQIESQFRQWLIHEQNDGYRNLSETCRIAMNNTFLKQLERLSVETLQFANAKISNVSQYDNQSTSTTPAEKIVINAKLDIDHLLLNIVNTFQEKHFSVETPKLFGQLQVILSMNSSQYSIEVHLQQIQIKPVNIIDPNEALSIDEKKTMTRLLDDTIKRTVVRCSFRLSDNQENTNPTTIQMKSPIGSHLDMTKSYSSSGQLLTTSMQTNVSTPRQPTPTRYQTSELSPPTLLVNDNDPHLYPQNLHQENEPKRLLVRVVKAVKLHNVENPYCILEINHPKQVQQTSIANNGINPFWDERFLFDCDEKSNQIHLQIIDRKTANKRAGSNYTDTLYADVTIPFSYVTSTVYKEDVQISPQHPESIIRMEFSTLSEEEALAANNGYDVESLTDSQTWTYNDRETNKLEQEYSQRYHQTSSNDYLSSSYDNGSLPKHYGLSTSLYTDERDYASTLPRSMGHLINSSSFSPATPLSPLDGGSAKPHKSKSFMSSLKHLTLPRRKHKDKRDHSMSSQTSSTSQLNTSLQSPSTNPVSHSVSSALPGPYPHEYILGSSKDSRPIRRSRSISQSFKNLFRSSSKKKNTPARTDALSEFGNVDHRNYLSTSTPTAKKLSFLQRRKSKQKNKHETNASTNSLSSYDYARTESVRDTPIRANVGHPVTMNKSTVR